MPFRVFIFSRGALGILAFALSAGAQPRPPAPGASSAPAPASVPFAAAAHSSNVFALDLYKNFAASPGNVFFSPYSVSTALAMTWAGALGLTAAQFAALFHADSGAPAPAAFGLLQQAVTASASGHVQLAIANSLWPQQDHPFLPAYLALVQDAFASGVFPVDYQTNAPAAVDRINAWVADRTNNRIQNLIGLGDVSRSTSLILVNAIYFKGAWTSPFKAEATRPDRFFLADGSNLTASFMHQRVHALYAELPNSSKILSLPYVGGNLSFIAILPATSTGLPALEHALTWDALDTLFRALPPSPLEVDVSLPKFKLTEHYGLGQTLKTLGLTDAFNPAAADFSGMDGQHDLFVSEVIHQAFINVNEQGTEAAAATGVMMAGAARQMPQPAPAFNADHPFLFLIRDNRTGAILFLGRLAAPPAAE
jgi:serpin B